MNDMTHRQMVDAMTEIAALFAAGALSPLSRNLGMSMAVKPAKPQPEAAE
jgi:hypothetical protein